MCPAEAPSTSTRQEHAGAEGNAGEQMYAFIEQLYPICRSITGNGVRATLDAIAAALPENAVLERHEVPSGTPVLDWTVPDEWNVRDAYVANEQGERVIDFRAHNLHVVSYSVPLRRRMTLEQLRPHLHSLPEQPDAIPYRTSYYQRNWGFCLPHRLLESLPDGEYEVVIDSNLEAGALSYGELLLPGESQEEVLFSTHICHPSLCNDNLSGIAVATWLARQLAALPRRRYRYRFLFVPGTIGAITWLARNEALTKRIRHGLVLTGLGDAGPLTYKRSRRGNADIDRVSEYVLAAGGGTHRILPFSPLGYDERQYGSPGFDLPVGRLSRTPHGEYPEYHTSLDDLSFVHAEQLERSLDALRTIVGVLERNRRYRNLHPKGEPQLGRRGLYGAIGGLSDAGERQRAMLWALNLSDGKHDLLEIAHLSALPFDTVAASAELLASHELLKESEP